MNSYIQKIRKLAKTIIEYTIEGEEKVYRLKGTPLRVKKHYTRRYHRELENLPIQPNKIVFDNYMGKGYGCNGKYVAEALLSMGKDFDIVWTVQNPIEQRELFPEQVRLVQYGSQEAMREYATAGVWVQNYQLVHYLNKGMLKKAGQTYIQMWHGSFGIKKIENDCLNLTQDRNWATLAKRNSEYTDYWISNSRFETAIYRQAFWNVKKVLEFGHPRNDLFFGEKSGEVRAALEQYIGKKNHKLLLYVPTFRDDYMEWEQQLDYKQLKNSLEQRFSGNWLILIRMHPRMREYADKLIPKEEFCIDVTEYPDIQELLAASDAAITDYSSAIFDFVLTGRPAFIYASDYVNYQNMRGLYYPLEDTPFSIAANNEELTKNIAVFDETVYKEKVREFLENKGSVENGNAANRVAELIIKCVEEKKVKGRNEYGTFKGIFETKRITLGTGKKRN